MKDQKPDRLTVLSMNTPGGAQAQEDTLYQNGDPKSGKSVFALKEDVTFSFLGPEGKPETRQARYYLPKAAQGPFPLILSVHYEIPDGDRVLYEYLSRGWAVFTPTRIPIEDLMQITGRDLRCASAMVSLARRSPNVDPLRIALRGCSAGGYQAMLLAALRGGLCAAYSMSGVYHLPYEFGFYIPQSNEHNLAMAHTLTDEQRADFNNYLIPYVKTVADTFEATRQSLGVENPLSEKWLRYSPVSHLDKITCPVLLSHSTADAIVPVYQATEACAPPEPGASLPAGYRLHLREFIPGAVLNLPLDELVAPGALRVFRFDPPAGMEALALQFDPGCRFSLNLIDEGPVEKECSHFKNLMSGLVDDTGFFQAQFMRGAGENGGMTVEKLRWLAGKYRGRCALFSEENGLRADVRAGVFGSLADERLDTLLDLLAGVGLNPWADPGAASLSKSGVSALETAYGRLSPAEQFLGPPAGLPGQLAADAARCARACGEIALTDRLRAWTRKLEN